MAENSERPFDPLFLTIDLQSIMSKPKRGRNGAQELVVALRRAGVVTMFANPGTTEMCVVEALDTEPGLRGVLCLHENVATGAADGYARMTGSPAAVLLHLGVGLANGLANLHNAKVHRRRAARRARARLAQFQNKKKDAKMRKNTRGSQIHNKKDAKMSKNGKNTKAHPLNEPRATRKRVPHGERSRTPPPFPRG